jgi:hypothetical protein
MMTEALGEDEAQGHAEAQVTPQQQRLCCCGESERSESERLPVHGMAQETHLVDKPSLPTLGDAPRNMSLVACESTGSQGSTESEDQASEFMLTKLSSTRNRHEVDRFDYFLGHKKKHSTLGELPEQIAKNIHDALEVHGHKGFFDVDDLEEISRENLQACIGQSSTMIVFMNDETMKSEWCLFEWQTAHRLGIPIKVVVDVSHCVKRDVVNKIQDSHLNFLLKYQWEEYSDSTRRAVVRQLSNWVFQQNKDIAIRKLKQFLFNKEGALHVKDDAETTQLFHNFFEYYMVFCGLVYNEAAWSTPVLLWAKVVRCMSIACFGICLWRLIYATGPAYTDRFSCLYVVLIHVFLYHGILCMTSLLSSQVMKELLQHIANSDLVGHTTRRVNIISKWAAIVGFSAGATFAAAMVAIYLPLFLSDDYMDSTVGKAFGISSAAFFVSVAPIVLVQEFAVFTLLFATIELLSVVFESAVCTLHDLIPTVGLRKFVMGSCESLTPTDAHINRFSKSWSNSLVIQNKLQSYVNPMICFHFLLNLFGLLIPVVYLAYGEEFLEPGDEPWSKWAKPILWWVFSVLCYAASIFVPGFASHSIEQIAEEARCLPLVPKTKEFLLITLQRNLSWRLGPIRLSGLGALMLTAPVLGSAACWALVFSAAFH